MTDVLGIDIQYTRSVLALREGRPGAARLSLLGDGRRTLIPNARTGDAWGSAAAEQLLRDGPATAEQLADWRSDPWSEGFLRGVHRRTARYLGLAGTTPTLGCHTVVCTAPGAPADVEQRCEKSGFGRPSRIGATDALVCRWLAEGGAVPPERATVLAVVCGEQWTVLAPYQVVHVDGQPLLDRRAADAVHGAGAGPWTDLVAREVLARCDESTPARDLLALLDAALECAGLLDAEAAVPWHGPLADRLFTPLALHRDELAGRPEVAGTVGEAHALAQGAAPDAELVLLGGVGGVWPFLRDALTTLAPVWRSPAPAADLAAGAAYWPEFRVRLSAPAHDGAPAPATTSTDPGPTDGATASAGLDHLPPWERWTSTPESWG
ncbi:hypothetical protein AAW14_21120 [Streptomyces hygroscopicus]|uniref:hypothetical protein n=1 Tax=Streptomyces hygroscopicus TaxID=1912 RepID=UPI00223EB5A5|nr:hypothetical protein [Streptomyces hygroscopicus]MCW7944444.1 hypothetical protein [Streptomyces hygroscopicus]